MTQYVLGERIGVGGMAEIFRAKAVAAGGFEKPVAIKRILPHLCQDQRFVDLLISEAKLLSQLRHRNIAQIFDVGLGEDGQFFLVMEFVDGTDLGVLYEKLESARKRLPLAISLHIVAEVCDALEYAHRARDPEDNLLNLVHRDVSPANVLLSRSGEVKLTDFGIAKQAEEHTGHGGVRGKFAYIAPEQAMNQHVDARSDVYSAGVVLYELILGHRLFSGMPEFDALRAVRDGRIKAPRDVEEDIDPRLEQILLRSLNKDPNKRFPSAGKLGAELRGYRYSMDEPGGDPAKEISRILAKTTNAANPSSAAAGKQRSFSSEPTEVTTLRIKTAAGFRAADFDSFSGSTVGDWRASAGFDEEEETTEMKANHLVPPKRRISADAVPDELDSADTGHDSMPPEMTGPSASSAKTDRALIEPENVRAATPTVRELFHTGALLDTSSELGSAPSTATVPPVGKRHAATNKKRLIVLVLATAFVGAAAFVAGRYILPSKSESTGTANNGGLADAGVADSGVLEMPAEVVPEKRKRPRRRKRPRKKKRKRASKSAKSKKAKK